MILNHHKTSESMEVVIGVDHLTLLEWKGDKNIKSLWENITRRMTDQLTELTLRNLLLKKLRNSRVLQEDLAHYDRMETDDPNRKIGYVWKCVDRAIRMDTEKENATAQHYLRNELTGTGGSAATPGKVSPKKAAKKKKAKDGEAAPAPAPRGRDMSTHNQTPPRGRTPGAAGEKPQLTRVSTTRTVVHEIVVHLLIHTFLRLRRQSWFVPPVQLLLVEKGSPKERARVAVREKAKKGSLVTPRLRRSVVNLHLLIPTVDGATSS